MIPPRIRPLIYGSLKSQLQRVRTRWGEAYISVPLNGNSRLKNVRVKTNLKMDWKLHSRTESLRKQIGNLRQDIVNIFRSQRRFIGLVRKKCASNEF